MSQLLRSAQKTGDGIDGVIELIESPLQVGRRILEIDYDVYADGEAALGWVNLSCVAHCVQAGRFGQIRNQDRHFNRQRYR